MMQRELAERLEIPHKTVSKWERGNGLPEVELMMPLCDLMGITVNELLSGERLEDARIKSSADENLLSLMENNKEIKTKFFVEGIVILIMLIASITLVMVASYVPMASWQRIVLIAIALVIILLGVIGGCIVDKSVGTYKCPHCGEIFVPNMKDYALS